ncbi:SCO family protein [Xenophilus sp. Marseille-Q4582]|uniref:SCO family protein n=1 Tax=Xenophilus sp. Marseille-Q4582 TaxID=2866600 RepID=UPI001CE3F76C|nr:SCO family protein [Xenophilus sp. Marseille-Q4582]
MSLRVPPCSAGAPRPAGLPRRQWIARALLLPAAGAAATLGLGACSAEKPPAFRGIDVTGAPYGQKLRLNDPDGRPRTIEDFRGQVVLLFFGFTQCPDVCPTALARAAEVKRLLGADGEKLQVIFVSVDPERDTAEVLKAYTAAFDPSFVGLSGDAAQTAEAAREFRVVYTRVPTGSSYTLDHSALSYLIDPQGRLRVALRHEQSAADFAANVRQLLREG